jgi:hypothetical protein
MEWSLKSVFEKLGVLGSPLSNYADLEKVIIISPKVDVPPGVLKPT